MLVKEIRKGGYNGGVGSDPKIGNVLVQGCTNGGLRSESQSEVRCTRVQRLELMLWSRNRDNQYQFQTEEHTWGLECIGIKEDHVRVTRIGHISGLGVRKTKMEQNCKVKQKHETKRGLETWNTKGNIIWGWMSKWNNHDDKQRMDGMTELTEVP